MLFINIEQIYLGNHYVPYHNRLMEDLIQEYISWDQNQMAGGRDG